MKSIKKIAVIIAAAAFTLSGLFAATDLKEQRTPKFKDIKVVNYSDFKVKLAFFDAKKNKKDITLDPHEKEIKTLQWFSEGIPLAQISAIVLDNGTEHAPITSDITWNGTQARLNSIPANPKITINASVDPNPKILEIIIDNITDMSSDLSQNSAP